MRSNRLESLGFDNPIQQFFKELFGLFVNFQPSYFGKKKKKGDKNK